MTSKKQKPSVDDLYDLAIDVARTVLWERSLALLVPKLSERAQANELRWLMIRIGVVIGLSGQMVQKLRELNTALVVCFVAWFSVFLLALFGFTIFGGADLLALPISAVVSAILLHKQVSFLPRLPLGSKSLKAKIVAQNVNLDLMEVLRTQGLEYVVATLRSRNEYVYLDQYSTHLLSTSVRSFVASRIFLGVFLVLAPALLTVSLILAFLNGRNGWYNWIGINLMGW